MSASTLLATALLVSSIAAGAACTAQSVDDSQKRAGTVLDDARTGAGTALDATKKAADQAAEAGRDAAHKTKDLAGDLADKGKDVALATGSAITDGWVTTKIKAKFADETVLAGNDISVDTDNHVVTLKGSVRSAAARAKAGEIATGTEGVTRVINEIIVRKMVKGG